MFKPTQAMAKAKSKMHRAADKNPLIGKVSTLSINKLEQISGVKNLDTWIAKDGFKEWFFDTNNIEDLMEANMELGMERVTEILSLPIDNKDGVKAGEILKAVEMLLKYTGREPKKQSVVEYQDTVVSNMDETKLDKYIEKQMKHREKITEELELVAGHAKRD